MQQIAVKIYDPSRETPGKPDFKQTIRYIFQYIDFAISEDEANVITSLFVEIWDSHQGQNITDETLKQKVYDSCRNEFVVFLTREKIDAVVNLILSYLRSIHQY